MKAVLLIIFLLSILQVKSIIPSYEQISHCSQDLLDSAYEFYDQQNTLIKQLEDRYNALLLKSQQKTVEPLKDSDITSILNKVQKNGILIGNKWAIREEGTNSYEALVFRDLVTTPSKDSRYAIYNGKSKDY